MSANNNTYCCSSSQIFCILFKKYMYGLKINYFKLSSISPIKITYTAIYYVYLIPALPALPEIKSISNPRGRLCSINGNMYENELFNIVSNCTILNKKFNLQKKEDLGGSSNKIDLICNYKSKRIGIEAKKSKTPDWMQCGITFDNNLKRWKVKSNNKHPADCNKIFSELIRNINIYEGEIPPFMNKKITHEQWIYIKKNTNKWDDVYINISSDTISRLYRAKQCHYIQISDGYGLYHTGQDVCGFGVPYFNPQQVLRIRTKIHKKINKQGFCNISITIACKPKNIKTLIPSKYSLDNIKKLPQKLIYRHNFQ